MRTQELGYDWAALARLRGLFLVRANQAAEAEPLLRQAFDGSHPVDAEVADALARIYLGSFRLGEAAAILDRWSREVPGDARPHLLRTEIDMRTSARHEVLIAHYRAALERDPSLDRAHRGLAEELRVIHMNADAALEYTRYMIRRPDDCAGYVGAGLNKMQVGEFTEATRLLEKALALKPHDPVALAARGEIDLRNGRPDSALTYFDRAVRADPFQHPNRYQRMLVLASLGKKAEADAERQTIERLKVEQAHFDKISQELVRNPLDSQLRGEAALWLMSHGREDEAVEWANLVLLAEPSHPAMNRLLADYYRKAGQLGRANLHEVHAAQLQAPAESAH